MYCLRPLAHQQTPPSHHGVSSCLLCNYVEYIKSKPAENGKSSGPTSAKQILMMSVKGGNGYNI